MKKLAFIFIILFSVVILVVQCKKEEGQTKISNSEESSFTYENDVDKRIDFLYAELMKNTHDKSIFQRIWKWMVAHSGVTMFGDCGLKLPCGQCPGFCPFASKDGEDPFKVVSQNYRMSNSEYDDGKRMFEAALFNDSTMAFTFLMPDLVYEDFVYIFENMDLGAGVANEFGKKSIVLKEGGYPVSYSRGSNGTALIDVITE